MTTEEKTEKINPGCLVVANMYDPFTKTMKVHPYYVWKYNGTKHKTIKNIYAFRISSRADVHEKLWWSVPVEPDDRNGLDKKSYIITDAIHLLNIENCTIIGYSDAKTFFEAIKARQKVQQVEIVQAIKSYGKIKVSEQRYQIEHQEASDYDEDEIEIPPSM